MRLPMLSRVTCLKIAAPALSRLMCTAAPPFSSKPAWASLILSPVSSTSFFTGFSGSVPYAPVHPAIRNPSAPHRQRLLHLGHIVFYQSHFQRRGTTENILGLGGILNPGQLHHDAVFALLLNDRLGDTQLIDAIMQGGDVLFHQITLDTLQLFRAQID